MKRHLFGWLYGLLLSAFTAYVLLDTFVITRVYQTAPDTVSPITPTAIPEFISGDLEVADENGGMSYSDENIDITLTEYRVYDTTVYVADVSISSPEYLQTVLAHDAYGKNVTQKTSEMAQNHQAILAVNGDYYGSRERGYVLRNGTLYRSSATYGQEDLVVYRDGSMEIIREEEVSAEELLANGAQQIFSFGPALVSEGQIAVSVADEVGKAMASNPRTAIGLVNDLNYLFVVSDGRTDESEGLSLMELAEFMKEFGAVTAYNLDGGGSSTMYFRGEIINKPTTCGNRIKERGVSDIVCIGY